MAWWTKAASGIEKHETKLDAMIRLNLAHHAGREPRESLGLYRRNPEQFIDEPNLLPAMIIDAQTAKIAEQIRAIQRSGR